MELGEECRGNTAVWQQRASEAIGQVGVSSRQVSAFRQMLAKATMSTNVSAAKILAFDRSDLLLHSRQFAACDDATDEPWFGRKAAWKQWHSGRWSARRSAFENLWRHGRRIIYGAVNIGGRGTRGRFGPFCLVINDPTAPGRRSRPSGVPRVGVFPTDTAQTYTDPDGVVITQQALHDIACWDSRADVAISKHAGELAQTYRAEWPTMVCRRGQYIEVAVADPVRVSDVAEVRISPVVNRFWTKAYARRDLGPREQRLADALRAITEWHTLGVQIEVTQ